MKKLLTICVGIISHTAWSQKAADPYKMLQSNWQQRVSHQISVTLDEHRDMLMCEETITYQNNSPDDLEWIYMHLWPNAFSGNRTPYGREAELLGNTKYLNAEAADRGFLDSLAFEIDGAKTGWEYAGTENTEIIRVKIPNGPLKSGHTAIIKTPFRVKIPYLFSRMGRTGSLYSITQWYPKPAVYDVNGWNVFPYLEQGEYFSEFGAYEVSLNIPAGFVIGATGVLQNAEEKEWMQSLASGSGDPRKGRKQISFRQDSVSDFAWFADPEFKVAMKQVKLNSGRTVTAVYLENSRIHQNEGLASIERALQFYSDHVGEYPYDFCTAVVGGLTAAGGMEYPMITICGDHSNGTIIHEVGHNWFQGMLGSQERRFPWMDESVNTFYQQMAEEKEPKVLWPAKMIPVDAYASFRLPHDLGVFQAGNLKSGDYTEVNYGMIVYSANPYRFFYLREYLGKAMLDSCMKAYFLNWHHRHPLPGDMQAVFEQISGENLSWFFNGLLGSQVPDPRIVSVKRNRNGYGVRIKNKAIPGMRVKLQWMEKSQRGKALGTEGVWVKSADTVIVVTQKGHLRLDPTGYLTEGDLTNNDANTDGLYKKISPVRLGLPGLYSPDRSRMWIFPVFYTFNYYDGFTPGLIISNITFPRLKWEWWLQPSWGVKSGTPVGTAGIRRNIWFNSGPFSMIEITAKGKTYTYRPDSMRTLQRYLHGNAGFDLYLKRKKSWVQHLFSGNYTTNSTYSAFLSRNGWGGVQDSFAGDRNNQIVSLKYCRMSYRKTKPGEFSVSLEQGHNILFGQNELLKLAGGNYNWLKFRVQAMQVIPYHFMRDKKSGLKLEAYATGFLSQQHIMATGGVYNPVVSGANGGFDYAFSETLPGRSENYSRSNASGYSNQLLTNTAAMRVLPVITANRYVAGINLSTSFIPRLPLKLFADGAIAGTTSGNKTYWAAGLNMSSLLGTKLAYEINLPLIYSSGFSAYTSGWKFYQGVNFKVNLSLYDPFQLARAIYR